MIQNLDVPRKEFCITDRKNHATKTWQAVLTIKLLGLCQVLSISISALFSLIAAYLPVMDTVGRLIQH